MKQPNIIFDFGGVLVSDTSKEFQRLYQKNWSKKQTAAFSKICKMDDLGQLTIDQYCEQLQKNVTPGISLDRVRKAIFVFKLFKKNWLLANKLAKTHKVIILSNNSKNGPAVIAKKLNINYKKIPFINSSKLGIRKPNKKIYTYALQRFGFDPKQTLLIDDKERNLIPARKIGIKTFRYNGSYGSLLKFLKINKVSI